VQERNRSGRGGQRTSVPQLDPYQRSSAASSSSAPRHPVTAADTHHRVDQVGRVLLESTRLRVVTAGPPERHTRTFSAYNVSDGWSEGRQDPSLPIWPLKPHDRGFRNELHQPRWRGLLSQTPPSGRDWGPYGPPSGGSAGPQPKPARAPWRWYHRWWVMLGGILLALTVGALALRALQS
jgi:hypothetical protein